VTRVDYGVNGVLLQFFHWYLPNDAAHWRRLRGAAEELARDGFTAVWIPPAGKAAGGPRSVGYDTYDFFDLGEFDQKGAVPTKYGTKDELVGAIRACRDARLQVYADVVFNHKDGGDELEQTCGQPVARGNRNEPVGDWQDLLTWTRFTFPGRRGTYSDFQWSWWCFDSLDYDARTKRADQIYRLKEKFFETDVSHEHGNFDFLMANDLDTSHPLVRGELRYWGEWFLGTTEVDGFRLDAVKHIRAGFFRDWLGHLRDKTGKELFAVGEYWSDNLDELLRYLEVTNGMVSLFDRPLQSRFRDASNDLAGSFDLRGLFEGTLVQTAPTKAVTFVENHDTQPMQSLESTVRAWFKPHAYATILLREGGYPCVFYADYYGAGPEAPVRRPEDVLHSHRFLIDRFLRARHACGHGEQIDYFDHPNVVGWTRAGEATPAMAVLMANGFADGWKWMDVRRPNARFYDLTGHVPGVVETNADGWGEFRCRERSVSVWVEDRPGLAGA
jgi:alpha-amylase